MGMSGTVSGPKYVILHGRGLISVGGEDAVDFLQGLVSNDVCKAGPERALYAAFLTPQGKFMHDFLLYGVGDALMIECEAARLADFLRRLSMYKLRSKVDLADVTDEFSVAQVFGDGALNLLGLDATPGAAKPFEGGVACTDPRLAEMGARVVLPAAAAEATLGKVGFAKGAPEEYENLRLRLGIPDGSRDMIVDRAILLENGFEELGGVDFNKGCYIGQELTARTHFRGLIKKRLMPVAVEGVLPAPGTPIMQGEREAGEMRSGLDGRGLALIRLAALQAFEEGGAGFTSGDSKIVPERPGWARFPEATRVDETGSE